MKTDFFSKKLAVPRLAAAQLVGMSLSRRIRRGLSAWAPVFASAGALAVGSCSLLENDVCCWLEVYPYLGHPTGSAYNSSLLDSAGLAGIEVGVLGKTFAAEDFEPSTIGSATVRPRLAVTESGSVSLWVRLAQGSGEAASGTMSWTLKDNTKWVLLIERASRPLLVDEFYDYQDRCLVNIAPCQYKRLPIPEDLANYPGEYVWLVIVEYPAKVPDGAVY